MVAKSNKGKKNKKLIILIDNRDEESDDDDDPQIPSININSQLSEQKHLSVSIVDQLMEVLFEFRIWIHGSVDGALIAGGCSLFLESFVMKSTNNDGSRPQLNDGLAREIEFLRAENRACLLYTSDAADE